MFHKSSGVVVRSGPVGSSPGPCLLCREPLYSALSLWVSPRAVRYSCAIQKSAARRWISPFRAAPSQPLWPARRQTATCGARIETALIFGGLLALLLVLPHTLFGDGEKRYLELAQLLQGHGLSADKYSLIGPLFSSPLWLLGALYRDPAWWLARFNLLVFAAGLGVIYLLLRNQVNRRLLRRFFLILIVGSMFPNHLKAYYGEVFTAVLVGVGLSAAIFGRRLTVWASVAIGVANTPATLLALAAAVAAAATRAASRVALTGRMDWLARAGYRARASQAAQRVSAGFNSRRRAGIACPQPSQTP